MPERRLKLPDANVTAQVEQFKRAGGQQAEEFVKLLETITKWEPERGKEVPNRPMVRRIGQKQTFPDKELTGEVFYAFNDRDVVWLTFKGYIIPLLRRDVS